MTDARVASFRILKPPCVALSQIALAYKARKASNADLVQALRTVLAKFEEVEAWDVKLADYAFFPLSHVFREISALSTEAAQLCLKCLDILIRKGWSLDVDPGTCKQLTVLLVFIFGASTPGNTNSTAFADETTLLALHCQMSLVRSCSRPFLYFCQNYQDEAVPVVGNTINIVLSLIKGHSNHNIQYAAAETMVALITCLKYEKILKDFLPGVISSLTQTVQPVSTIRRLSRVIVKAIEALRYIIEYTLGDQFQTIEINVKSSKNVDSYSDSWVLATSGQVRLALARIIKLRYHEKEDVQKALFELCYALLTKCKSNLRESADILLETAMILCASGHEGEWQRESQSLIDLIERDDSLADFLKTLLYSLLSSLPTRFSDIEPANLKKQLDLISVTYKFAARLGISMEFFDDSLLASLKESVKVSFQCPHPQPLALAALESETSFRELPLVSGSTRVPGSESAIAFRKEDIVPLEYLRTFIETDLPEKSRDRIKKSLVERFALASPEEKMISMWIFLRLMLPASTSQTENVVLVSVVRKARDDQLLQIAYSTALETLSNSPTERIVDWRHQTIALEIVALKACSEMEDFQPDLVDILFPVLERIGIAQPIIRQHAIVCLNIITKSCGLGSGSELIIQNVDYLVNALALKLNSFEMDPIAPRVLVMMIELCGADLIPYLDDITNSLLSALAMFHGYHNLVNEIISVLDSIVKQARISSEKSIGTEPKLSYTPLDLSKATGLVHDLKDVSADIFTSDDEVNDEANNTRGIPGSDGEFTDSQIKSDIGQQIAEESDELGEHPVNKSYEIVQSIVKTGQHYLTHPSAYIRQRLLNLLAHGFTVLSENEDIFLPLVNEIWPTTFRRLLDSQAEVRLAAMESLSIIFQFAGDFVSSRVEDEWLHIRRLCEDVKANQAYESKGKGGRGHFSASTRAWEGLVDFLTSVCLNLRVTAEMEDDLIEILAFSSQSRPVLRSVLETLNGDALWLVLEKQQKAIM